MKYINSLLPIILMAMIACGGDSGNDPVPVSATTLDKLQGTWNLGSAKVDGTDVTADFSGFAITISGTSYGLTTANITNANVWTQGSGTLGISGDNATTIDLGGNSNISLAFSNNDKTLTLSFTVTNTTFGGGRISGLAGNYVFVLNK